MAKTAVSDRFGLQKRLFVSIAVNGSTTLSLFPCLENWTPLPNPEAKWNNTTDSEFKLHKDFRKKCRDEGLFINEDESTPLSKLKDTRR